MNPHIFIRHNRPYFVHTIRAANFAARNFRIFLYPRKGAASRPEGVFDVVDRIGEHF